MKRIIIKIGSSSIIDESSVFKTEVLLELTKQIKDLKNNDYDVMLVSSGAIGAGMNKLGLKSRPKNMALKQACAALGQASLMKIYEDIFSLFHLKCAQILVGHDDFENRGRMVHLSNTLEALFNKGVIPIVNENDALAVDEIKVGDNDTLGALLVPMINASKLVLITDVKGLYTGNPSLPSSKLIPFVDNIDDSIWDLVVYTNSQLGTGGMETKLKAGVIANDFGSDMIIMGNEDISFLSKSLDGGVGTLFKGNRLLSSRGHWLLFKNNSKGIIKIDPGAMKALKERHSLLPKGIIEVIQDFGANACVDIMCNEEFVAKGIVNYSSDLLNVYLKGNYVIKKEVIHADNLILIGGRYGRFIKPISQNERG